MITSLFPSLTEQPLTFQHFLLITTATLALSILAYVLLTEIHRHKARLPSLPGPTGIPILGNYSQLSPDPAETLRQWSLAHGSVYQTTLGNLPVVVVNSMAAAREIFIGQGHATVDRPQLYTFHGVLSSVASSIGTNAWNENTKRRRKVAAGAMNRPSVKGYLGFIVELTEDMLRQLERKGEEGRVAFDPRQVIAHSMVDLTMTIHYGARLPSESGLLEEIVDVEDGLSRIKSPLGSLQDFVPILRWVPWMSNSKTAREINKRRLVYLRRFDRELKDRIARGEEGEGIARKCLEDPEAKIDDVDLLSISMSMVSGGLDTMVNTLAWTIGTLALREDVQSAAYSAITAIYGPNTPPDAGDEQGVPYITALMKESLRHFSTLRLSLPRAAHKDVSYKDFLIPKGTTMFLNVWAANHDEDVFGSDAWAFRPERFLEEPELPHASYGFGTRMCAGVHLANRQLEVLLTRLLWKFEIKGDGTMEQLRPLEDVTEPWHLAAIPPAFKVRFVPRNQRPPRTEAWWA